MSETTQEIPNNPLPEARIDGRILKNGLLDSGVAIHLYVYVLLMAAKTMEVRSSGGVTLLLSPGECIVESLFFAKRYGYDQNAVRRAICKFETMGIATTRVEKKRTIVKIANWEQIAA